MKTKNPIQVHTGLGLNPREAGGLQGLRRGYIVVIRGLCNHYVGVRRGVYRG